MTSKKPIAFPVATVAHVGTAFIVGSKRGNWLVTTGHNFTGMRLSTRDWSKWDQDLFIGCSDGSRIRVPMFDAAGEPLFGWAPDQLRKGLVDDAVALPVSAALVQRIGCAIIQRSSIGPVAKGQTVTFFGYPGISDLHAIPPLRSKSGCVVNVEHGYIFINVASEEGYSGGPVFAGPHLVGMVSGNTKENPPQCLAIHLVEMAGKLFGAAP